MRVDRIGIQNTRANFTGFSDVLALSKKDGYIGEFNFIAMKLNNEGTNDLDKFQDLKRRLGCSSDEVKKDILFFTRMNEPNGREMFTFESNPLLSGKDLLEMEASKAVYKEDAAYIDEFGKINIKIYTFLSNLTKRMSEASVISRNMKDTANVGVHTVNKITDLCGTQLLGIFMVNDAMTKHDLPTYQAIARNFNKSFVRNMQIFFK